jgi:tetratricopeptide (TPR) repeat protein
VLIALDNVRADEGCETTMNLLAVLSAAGVPRSFVHAATAPDLTPEAADRALARLAGVSLVTFSVDGSVVTAHRLVMRVIRENLTADGSLTAVCLAAFWLLDGEARTRWPNWHEDRTAVRDLIEQIMSLSESASSCPAGSDLDIRIYGLRHWALMFLNTLGDSLAQAIAVGESLLADRERVLGRDHGNTLTTRNGLATAYQAAGRTGEAITLHEQVLTGFERTLGPDHPQTLTSRNNLATAYQAVGRTGEAITLHEQTLAIRERTLGPDHPDTLQSRNNLATAYHTAGRRKDAEKLQS